MRRAKERKRERQTQEECETLAFTQGRAHPLQTYPRSSNGYSKTSTFKSDYGAQDPANLHLMHEFRRLDEAGAGARRRLWKARAVGRGGPRKNLRQLRRLSLCYSMRQVRRVEPARKFIVCRRQGAPMSLKAA